MNHISSHVGKLLTVRVPQAGDEELLFTYAQELGQEDTYVLLNPQEPVTWVEEVNYLKSTLEKNKAGWEYYLMVFDGEKMVGSSQITKKGRRRMHVGEFGISFLPAYRGQGFGEALARKVLNEGERQLGLTLAMLEVFSDNTMAQKLYQKLGFEEYGRLPQGLSYKDRFNDAILMWTPLPLKEPV